MVSTMAETTSPGREGHRTSALSKEIVRYPCKRLITPIYKTSAAEGQAGEAASYFCRSLLSNLRDWKKYHEARFTSFYISIAII